MTGYERHRYKYIDDTGNTWAIYVSDLIATAGKLQQIRFGEQIQPPPGGYHFRHIKVIGLEERPGQQKYRAAIIVNERNPAKLLGTIIKVGDTETRCIKYVGEQRRPGG